MKREEAKEILTHNWTRVDNPNYSESELDEALDMAIEALDERKVELFDDGTLVVNVKEGEKVGRVLIDGDDHFGGLYYIDAEPKRGEWVAAHIGETTSWYVECSECHVVMPPVNYNYCPNCGAKMDKGGDTE